MKKGEVNVPAPLWKRACAYVIDALIVSVVILFPLNRLYPQEQAASLTEAMSMMQQGFTKTHILAALLVGILTILYWAVLEYKLNQTLGKMLMKIKVRSLNAQLTFKQCVVRNITKLSFLLLLLDTLYTFKSGSQRFFDTLAQTQVVEARTFQPGRKKR